ncbi:MAG TPA: NHL repeat-containing protein [Solirubrobacterales bacterium]|nr:NHL repeat-containing protein [Solirubrobacterales bacterium]
MGRLVLGGPLRRAASLLGALALLALAASPGAGAFEWLGQYGRGSFTLDSGGVGTIVGIGVAPDGTVVLADIGASRVTMFAAGGRFLRNVGKDVAAGGGNGPEVCTDDCKSGEPGSAGGELAGPWGVAAGPGEFYVSELNNSRVSAFDYDGDFLRAFGADVGGPGVDVCTASCTAGTSGAGDGQMAGPAGLALDAGGDLLVSELGTKRIDRFDPHTGAFLGSFGKDVGGPGVNTCVTGCMAGTADETPGSLNAVYNLAVAPGGEIVAGDNQTASISVFSAQGQFLRAFGGPGSGAGQLFAPLGVAVGAGGSVYVSEGPNNRFSVFDLDGDFLSAYGKDVVPGPPEVAEACTTVCKEGSSDYGIGELSFPEAIAADTKGNVYVDTFGRVDKWGEPPAAEAPEPTSPVSVVQSTTVVSSAGPADAGLPSNMFRFGHRSWNRRKGTMRVQVIVAGAGRLVARAGPKVAASVPQPRRFGAVSVSLRAKARGRRVLRRSGRLWAALRVTFTPRGGTPNTRTKAVRILRRGRQPVLPPHWP